MPRWRCGLGEVMGRQPLFVVLYERGDPADWLERTAGFVPLDSPLLCGCRGGIPHKYRPLPSGSLAEQAVQSGKPEYAEEDGIAVAAKPVLWQGRLAKVAVAAVPREDRKLLAPKFGSLAWRARITCVLRWTRKFGQVAK